MVEDYADITVILNCYRRPQYLPEQIAAIRNQTKKPVQIWLWVNYHEDNKDFNFSNLNVDRVIKNDYNWKYYGRFAAAMLADTKYVALFDDDTFMLAPTPTSGYTTELHYFYSPPSITEVAGGQTWLGTNAPECLLYGSMVQANLFLKGEADMQQLYETQYQEALARLRNESAGKSMQDSYRYGQPRQIVE